MAVLLGGLLAWPAAGVSAVTVTVGRQDLSTPPVGSFGCTATGIPVGCAQTVSPTALSTPGDRAVVPGDGAITSWRVSGSESGGGLASFYLRVLRRSGGQYQFVSGSEAAPFLNGTPIGLTTPLPVEAGDLLGIEAQAYFVVGSASAQVGAVEGAGATYNVFDGFVNNGTTPPSSMGENLEPLFNAEVVLDPAVVSGVSPTSGSTAGGETVTISGDHLAGASQVEFGGVKATGVKAVSNTEVTAVTPPSAAGTVDVVVTTLGGGNVASAADRFTFVVPTPPAAASFAGSPSTITVSRKRKFKFTFHGTPRLTGKAAFKSLRKVRVSRYQKVTLATKAFTVPASGEVTLSIRLSKKKFRILTLNRKIRTRLTATLENTAGLTSTASKKVTLKAPKRR